MSVTIIGDPALPQPLGYAAPIIEVRKRWSDPWKLRPDLEMSFCGVYASSSNVSQLHVRRKFGNVKRPFEQAFSISKSENLSGWFVRMRIMSTQAPITQFVGVFTGLSRDLQGTPTVLAGEQMFVAYGGLHILQKIEVSAAYFADAAGHFNKVDWIPSMNARDRRGVVVGNAQPDLGGAAPVYGGKSRWTHFGYLSYLVQRFIQQPGGPTWTIGGQAAVLKGMLTTINFPEVMKASDMISELIPVRYGLDYHIVPTEQGFEINVFSLSDQAGSIGGTTLPTNPNTVRVIKSSQLDLTDVKIVQSDERRVDKIVVQGKRIVVCGSLRGSRGPGSDGHVGASGGRSLVARWSTPLETLYISGDGLLATVPNATTDDFEQARNRDKFRAVYAHLGAPQTWDLDNGTWAVATNDSGVITQGVYQTAQRETLSYIPLKEGFDYSTNPPTDNTTGAIEPDIKHPLAWVYDETPIVRTSPGYLQADLAGINVHQPYMDWGLMLCASPNEKLALNHWTPTQQDTSNAIVSFDYNTAIATIAIESDHRLHIGYTVPANLAAGDGSVMTITDEGAELWVLLPQTVVDVDKVGNLKTSGSRMQILRNDLDRISLLAAGLIVRYVSTRFRASLEWKGHMPWGALVGSILDTITQGTTSEKISAPITSIEWTCPQGATPSTTIKAGYA